MSELDLVVNTASAQQFIARLEELPEELRKRLEGPIRRIAALMTERARAGEPEKTGALRAATQPFVRDGYSKRRGNYVRGGVRVAAPAGARFSFKSVALEYGAHGRVQVAAHQMMHSHLWSKQSEPREITVHAYQRQANITALHFMRDALASVRGEFEAAVAEAVAEVTRSA